MATGSGGLPVFRQHCLRDLLAFLEEALDGGLGGLGAGAIGAAVAAIASVELLDELGATDGGGALRVDDARVRGPGGRFRALRAVDQRVHREAAVGRVEQGEIRDRLREAAGGQPGVGQAFSEAERDGTSERNS